MPVFGFTGTRKGMTPEQREAVIHFLADATRIHHGDCVGADAEVHDIAVGLGIYIVRHPPLNEVERARLEGGLVLPAREYLNRNRDIVDISDVMIAVPKSKVEEYRGSGTWATIRYALKKGKPVTIVYPDGEIERRE